MATPIRYVIGLGSNLGDRLALLRRAVIELAGVGPLARASRLYESDPWGGPEQGPFLNAAVALDSGLGPALLLERLLEIERKLGRERRERWGPRTIDLDLLWARGVTHSAPGLRVPHERLTERTFALGPLLEVEPDAEAPAGQEIYPLVLQRLRAPILRPVLGSEWTKAGEISAAQPHHALR